MFFHLLVSGGEGKKRNERDFNMRGREEVEGGSDIKVIGE